MLEKIKVSGDEDYTIYLEDFDRVCFIHCDVYKWNKTTKIKIGKALESILEFGFDLHAFHDIDDDKHRKFLNMYDFKYFSTEACLDGLLRQVWIKQSKEENK